jgi:hypothetical protein
MRKKGIWLISLVLGKPGSEFSINVESKQRKILRDKRGRDERKGYGFGKDAKKKGKRG